jgi:hypothetical protein
MFDNERRYVDLIFRASKKYPSWDPEVDRRVGDWGRITVGNKGRAFWRRDQGIFLKEGNIYEDGKAKEYGIPPPKEYGQESLGGVTWITSENAKQCDVSVAAGGCVCYVMPRVGSTPSS